jgi:hypothetical protein
MRKGSHMTEEQCASNSAAQRAWWAVPENRERQVMTHLASTAMKDWWAVPENHIAMSAALSGHLGRKVSPDQLAKMVVTSKAWWAVPENRERQVVSHLGNTNALGPHIVSEEGRANMSAAHKGKRPPNKGIPATPQALEHMCTAHREYAIAHPEKAKKQGAAMRGRPSPMRGIPLTEETRKKLSDIGKTKVGPLANSWKGGPTPEKVKTWKAKNSAKRRDLGFLLLNSCHPGDDGHHTADGMHVVFEPKWLHRLVSHDHNTGRGMAEADALALAYAGLTADVLDDTLPFD